ncbi:MAG: hypothetical protein J6Q05_00625 [Elusimicrobiaceae bacterium]|nr:hypothetical protein [Elusimicrobiaceae bacterium]
MYALAGGLLVVLGGYRAVLVLAACYRAGGVSSYAKIPRGLAVAGDLRPAVLTLSTCQKTIPPTCGGWWPCGVSRPAKGLNTANAQTGGAMPLTRR